MAEPPKSVTVLDPNWPGRKLPVLPGDLTRMVPQGLGLDVPMMAMPYGVGASSGFYGLDQPSRDPFHSAPTQEPCGGILYFDDGVEAGALSAALVVIGVHLPRKDYAVFAAGAEDPVAERYLDQVRIISKPALGHFFEAGKDAEALADQPITLGAYIENFIAEQRAKWNDPRYTYSQQLAGTLGGDADWAKESLAFGFRGKHDLGRLPAVEPAMARYEVMASGPKAILIAGPTASGKSAAALALASDLHGTVINADSMQVYRELDVLAARPAQAEMKRVPHVLYGTVSASEAYSVGSWLEDASNATAEARSAGSMPILVGGTGLYFKALLEGLAPVPDIPPEVRAHWRAQAETLGAGELHLELAARDPAMAAKVRPSDTQRVVRALEVIDATGVSLAEWQGANAPPLLDPDTALKLVIAPEREPLYAAIDARFDRMIEAGALDEVRTLVALGLDEGLPAMRAHGVRELRAYLAGAASLEEAKAKAKIETRRYAKRQMTWLRRYMTDWEWFPDAAAAVEAATARLLTP